MPSKQSSQEHQPGFHPHMYDPSARSVRVLTGAPPQHDRQSAGDNRHATSIAAPAPSSSIPDGTASKATTPTDYAITEAMSRYGGSFARCLAEACRHADPEHFARLKAAFPELWAEYQELARLSERKDTINADVF